MAICETGSQTFPVRRSRAGLIGLWVAQVALASLFLLAGGSKLAGVPATVTLFEAIGVGQWFRYATGLIEVGSAIALLVPSLALFGAVALVATMLGAIVTHVFVVGGSPAVPAVLLLAALVVVWARRGQLFAALPGPRWNWPTHAPAIRTSVRLLAGIVGVFVDQLLQRRVLDQGQARPTRCASSRRDED